MFVTMVGYANKADFEQGLRNYYGNTPTPLLSFTPALYSDPTAQFYSGTLLRPHWFSLQFHEFPIRTIRIRHQRVVATYISDSSFFQEDDAVGPAYR